MLTIVNNFIILFLKLGQKLGSKLNCYISKIIKILKAANSYAVLSIFSPKINIVTLSLKEMMDPNVKI